MLDPRPRESNGSPKKPESPALASLLKCPNCGREPAIVFPLVRESDTSVEGAPLACMDCCLGARDRR